MDKDERYYNLSKYHEALRTIDDINKERKIKGNSNVTAGRYGELVANIVKFAESKMVLDMEKDERTPDKVINDLPSKQHVEPESLRGQNTFNPT